VAAADQPGVRRGQHAGQCQLRPARQGKRRRVGCRPASPRAGLRTASTRGSPWWTRRPRSC
jgi:hypothetical protein